MQKIYFFSSIILLFTSCSPGINYIGRSNAPTSHIDVYVNEAAIKKNYDIVGKGYVNGITFSKGAEKIQKKAIEKESTWRERKEHTIHFLQHEASVDQLLVSAADKLDNLRSIVYDHKKIGEKLWSRFNASKEQQAWYYTTVATILMDKGNDSNLLPEIGREMIDLCENVF